MASRRSVRKRAMFGSLLTPLFGRPCKCWYAARRLRPAVAVSKPTRLNHKHVEISQVQIGMARYERSWCAPVAVKQSRFQFPSFAENRSGALHADLVQ